VFVVYALKFPCNNGLNLINYDFNSAIVTAEGLNDRRYNLRSGYKGLMLKAFS
jgi:hypothetical protein